jgi:polyisoprenoid-binding protein YceI
MPASLISPQELDARRREDPSLVVLDVRLDDDFARRRIAGAANNCVYEVAFLERMPALAPDKNSTICVYGESGDSLEAEAAAEKLVKAGYTRVCRLKGCLESWCSAGLPQEGTGEPLPEAPVPQGRLTVDAGESQVEWTGRNLLNKHTGKVPLKSGWLQMNHGEIAGGELILDMTGITSNDLAGTPLHDVLVAHLRSDDFFDTDQYPEARLVIKHASRLEGASPVAQNVKVEAELTLKGITGPVHFTASAGVDDKGRCAAQAAFTIDRTKWKVLYGSGSFFHRLAGHLVNDMIELQVRVVAS